MPIAVVHSPGPSDEPAASTGNVRSRTTTAAIEATNHRMIQASHARRWSRGRHRVLVMEHGEVIEDGPPDRLIESGDGRFSDLHDAWLESLA